MQNKYFIIDEYRVALRETWDEFGTRFFEETGMSWKTLHKIVMGKSTPNKLSQRIIDDWFNKHKYEIVAKITGKELVTS